MWFAFLFLSLREKPGWKGGGGLTKVLDFGRGPARLTCTLLGLRCKRNEQLLF
jgi:hypothetical protein